MFPNTLLGGGGASKRGAARLAVVSYALAALHVSFPAHAQGKPAVDAESSGPSTVAPPSQALASLRSELDVYAERGRQERVVTNVTSVAAGLVLVPAGIGLARRSDPLAKTLGVSMAVGGSIPLVFVFATVLPSGMERLRADFDEQLAKRTPEPQLLQAIEAGWARSARSAHQRRHIIGLVDLTLGTAAIGAGLFFLVAKPVGTMSREGQYTLGYSLAGSGLPVAAFGVRSLLQESLEETSWRAHRAQNAHAQAASMPLVGVAPLPGGAAAVGTFEF
jgi:hypothetical protein